MHAVKNAAMVCLLKSVWAAGLPFLDCELLKGMFLYAALQDGY